MKIVEQDQRPKRMYSSSNLFHLLFFHLALLICFYNIFLFSNHEHLIILLMIIHYNPWRLHRTKDPSLVYFLITLFNNINNSGNIRFGLLSDVDMIKLSHVQVVNKELYQMPKRTPTANGCLDPRLVYLFLYLCYLLNFVFSPPPPPISKPFFKFYL